MTRPTGVMDTRYGRFRRVENVIDSRVCVCVIIEIRILWNMRILCKCVRVFNIAVTITPPSAVTTYASAKWASGASARVAMNRGCRGDGRWRWRRRRGQSRPRGNPPELPPRKNRQESSARVSPAYHRIPSKRSYVVNRGYEYFNNIKSRVGY